MSDQPKPEPTLAPRDQAGSIELTEGTGGLTGMCPCDDFLELYKEDVTFRLHTPETIDPERTNPNAPFAAMVAERIGTSSPIISRVLLQSRDLLSAGVFVQKLDKDEVTRILHGIKEHLVACQKAADTLDGQLTEIDARLRTEGLKRTGAGRTIPSVPQVTDLDSLATQFLISAKRAIKGICSLPAAFHIVDHADANFDHLGKRLVGELGGEHPLAMLVRDNAGGPRRLIELRNGQEHPKPGQRTHVSNVHVLPDGGLGEPTWHITGAPPSAVRLDMRAAVDLLVELAEYVILELVDHSLNRQLPFVIVGLSVDEVDAKKPIRYRLTLDASKLKIAD